MTAPTPARVSRAQREIQIAGMVRAGGDCDTIASDLGLTVDYVGGIIRRLGLDGQARPAAADAPEGAYRGVIEGLADDEYHGAKWALSSSGARMLLPPSAPALFRHAMDTERKPKREFDFGHIAHRLLLGDGARFEVLHPEVVGLKADGTAAANPRATAGWKQAEQEARERGRVPIHADDFRKAEAMVSAVRAHETAGPLFTDGKAEVSLFAQDPDTGVWLRARPDWWTALDGRAVFVDFKTAVSAEPETFARKATRDFGYHVQAAVYRRVAALLGLGDVRFLFVACEKTPPHLVSVTGFDAAALAEADRLCSQAIATYAACVESGRWPGYPPQIHTASLPPWQLASTPESKAIAAELAAEADDLIAELEGLTES